MYKVIVIDDEMLVRRGIVMETDWQALNCVVVAEAGNGIEGLEAVRKYHPDLLICDIRMPKMDGIEMLKELRAEGNDVSVIFLTAYSDFSYAQSALKLFASDYLLKPFGDGELEQAVNHALDKRKKTQECEEKAGDDQLPELVLNKGDSVRDRRTCGNQRGTFKSYFQKGDGLYGGGLYYQSADADSHEIIK